MTGFLSRTSSRARSRARSRLEGYALHFVLLSALMCFLSACGGDSTESLDAGADLSGDIQVEGRSVTDTGNLSTFINVNAGVLQVSDSNVLVRLSGEASIENGDPIQTVLWEQIAGPEVPILNADSLNCDVPIPDMTEPTQLDFRLTVWDTIGQSNSATTSILVRPQAAFARVIGGIVNESDGRAIFTINLNSPANQTLFVDYITIDGTALANADYVPVSGQLVFEPGDTSKTVTVTLINDGEVEPTERFNLQISTDLESETETVFGSAFIDSEQAPQLEQQIQFLAGDSITLQVGEAIDTLLDVSNAPGTGRVLFSSADPAIASVDVNGLATANAPGTTSITALKEADEAYLAATANITIAVDSVDRRGQNVRFENPDNLIQVYVGDTISNPIVVIDGVSSGITYSSSNSDFATVDDSGVVSASQTGTVTITANVPGDDEFLPATPRYRISILNDQLLPQVIRFVAGSSANANVGDTLDGSLDTSGAPGLGEITVNSSNPAIVGYNDGVIVANAEGTATITAVKAADDVYDEASTTFIVSVIDDGTTPGQELQVIAFEQAGPLQLNVGETLTNPLIISQGVQGATQYSSGNPAVATVDNNGVVTAIAAGAVTITASVPGNDEFLPASESYPLAVSEVELISQTIRFIAGTSVTTTIGKSVDGTLDTSAAPGTGEIVFSSSNPTVAAYNDGVIVTNAAGIATITAVKANDDLHEEATATITVTVNGNVPGQDPVPQVIAFEQAGPLQLNIGETLTNQLIISQGVQGATVYSSGDTAIATVNSAGLVTAVTSGSVTITASVPGNDDFLEASETYQLTVLDDPAPVDQVIRFIPDSIELEAGTTQAVELDTESAPGSGAITFTSSDPEIAEYDDGIVFAKAAGTVVIRADKAGDDEFNPASATLDVTVNDQADNRPAPEIRFEKPGDQSVEEGGLFSNPLIVKTGNPEGIEYESSDNSIATVNVSGEVIPLLPGEVFITATVPENTEFLSGSESYRLTVTAKPQPQPQSLRFVPADNVTITNEGISLFVGEDVLVELDESEAPGTGEITFTYSNNGVAVFENDIISSIDNGTTTITATKAADANFLTTQAQITVTVIDDVDDQDIAFQRQGDQEVFVDEVFSNPLIVSRGVSDGIQYSVDNTDLATVNGIGEVVPNLPGVVNIIASVPGNSEFNPASASYQLTIKARNQTPLLPQEIEFIPGNDLQLISGTRANVALDTSKAPGTGEITISYSNNGVAEFRDGVIIANEIGSTTLTAFKASDNLYEAATATINVTVTGKTLRECAFESAGNLIGTVGETLSNPFIVLNAASDGIVYNSSNQNVASVDSSGSVTLNSAGQAIINATAPETAEFTSCAARYQLTVVDKPPPQINFEKPEPHVIFEDEIFSNRLLINGEVSDLVEYRGNNSKIATVDDRGRVTPAGFDFGIVTITALFPGTDKLSSASLSYDLTVQSKLKDQVIRFSLNNPTQLLVGESVGADLDTSGAPGTGDIRFSSSDPTIASVEGRVIFAHREGTVVITAFKEKDNEYDSAEATVTVEVSGLSDQDVEFEQPGPLAIQVNGSIRNPVTVTRGVSEGITYSSSDEAVAQVNDIGEVFGATTGMVSIKAEIPGNTEFNPATIEYDLEVIAPERQDQRIRFVIETTTLDVKDSIPFELDLSNAPSTGELTIENTNPEVARITQGPPVARPVPLFMTAFSPGRTEIKFRKEGDDNYNPIEERLIITVRGEQDIRFEREGPISTRMGTTVSNPLVIHDGVRGPITYRSDNDNIASVDQNGVVTTFSTGEVTISASVPGNDEFSPASASYQLNVSSRIFVPDDIDIIIDRPDIGDPIDFDPDIDLGLDNDDVLI